jgi:hypothetical protein
VCVCVVRAVLSSCLLSSEACSKFRVYLDLMNIKLSHLKLNNSKHINIALTIN